MIVRYDKQLGQWETIIAQGIPAIIGLISSLFKKKEQTNNPYERQQLAQQIAYLQKQLVELQAQLKNKEKTQTMMLIGAGGLGILAILFFVMRKGR